MSRRILANSYLATAIGSAALFYVYVALKYPDILLKFCDFPHGDFAMDALSMINFFIAAAHSVALPLISLFLIARCIKAKRITRADIVTVALLSITVFLYFYRYGYLWITWD